VYGAGKGILETLPEQRLRVDEVVEKSKNE